MRSDIPGDATGSLLDELERPRTIRTWRAYEDEGPTDPRPLDAPAVPELPPLDDPDDAVRLEARHELLVKELPWFAAVPLALCERASRDFVGSLPKLLRAAITSAAMRIRASDADVEEPGIPSTGERLYAWNEERDFTVLRIDPNDLELVATVIQTRVDGGEHRPTLSRVVCWALERFCDDEKHDPTALDAHDDLQRPQPPPWSLPPPPPHPVAPHLARAFFAALADDDPKRAAAIVAAVPVPPQE